MIEPLISGYRLRSGSGLDRALLVKFLQQTYQELYPGQNFAHLARTVEQYFSKETPLWWVEVESGESQTASLVNLLAPIACLWMGNAIDQVKGDRHVHIFLLYVNPAHRQKGIGTALLHRAEAWAKERGDRQIGLQVFQHNQPALQLYQKLGYTTQSLWMIKPL